MAKRKTQPEPVYDPKELAKLAREAGYCPECLTVYTGGRICRECEDYGRARARGWED